MRPVVEVFAAVYWSVLVAELIGDKSLYAVSSLALRFPRRMVIGAIVAAYSIKMGCAVLLAALLLQFPQRPLALVSAAGFLGAALMSILRDEKTEAPARDADWRRGALACWFSLFVTEWADPGQLVVLAATARTGRLTAVWLAGTMAMITKGVLAFFLSVKLTRHLPQRLLRTVAAVSLTVLGLIALVGNGMEN